MNLFEGGVLDGQSHATFDLLKGGLHPLPVADYNWTPELRYDDAGREHRLWKHRSIPLSDSPVAASESRKDSPMSENVTLSDFEQKRKAAGVSRQQLAEATGLTAAKIYRIERNGDSKRTTEDEKSAYLAGLATAAGDKAPAAESPIATANDGENASTDEVEVDDDDGDDEDPESPEF